MQCKYNYNFVTWHGDGWGNSTVKVVNMNIKKKKEETDWNQNQTPRGASQDICSEKNL